MFYLLEEGRRVFGTFAKLIIFSMAIHFDKLAVFWLWHTYLYALLFSCAEKKIDFNKVETKQLYINASLLIQRDGLLTLFWKFWLKYLGPEDRMG